MLELAHILADNEQMKQLVVGHIKIFYLLSSIGVVYGKTQSDLFVSLRCFWRALKLQSELIGYRWGYRHERHTAFGTCARRVCTNLGVHSAGVFFGLFDNL